MQSRKSTMFVWRIDLRIEISPSRFSNSLGESFCRTTDLTATSCSGLEIWCARYTSANDPFPISWSSTYSPTWPWELSWLEPSLMLARYQPRIPRRIKASIVSRAIDWIVRRRRGPCVHACRLISCCHTKEFCDLKGQHSSPENTRKESRSKILWPVCHQTPRILKWLISTRCSTFWPRFHSESKIRGPGAFSNTNANNSLTYCLLSRDIHVALRVVHQVTNVSSLLQPPLSETDWSLAC